MATKRSEETLACFASTGFLSDEPITSPPSFEAESGSPARDDTRAARAGDIGAAFGALRGRPFALVVGGLALFIALLVTVIDVLGATVGAGFGTMVFGVTVLAAVMFWREQVAAFSRRDMFRTSVPRLTLTRTRL